MCIFGNLKKAFSELFVNSVVWNCDKKLWIVKDSTECKQNSVKLYNQWLKILSRQIVKIQTEIIVHRNFSFKTLFILYLKAISK